MTTIVVCKNQMACDGKSTRGSTIERMDYDKIWKYNNTLYGFCGSVPDIILAKEIIKGRVVYTGALSVGVLVLYLDEKVEEWFWKEGYGFVKEQTPNPHTVGSGSEFSRAALDMGADAKQAVAIAAKRDIYTGGKIRVKTLPTKKEWSF